MLHLPALPGAPRFQGDIDAIHARVLADAQTLADAGVAALLLENFGDAPFYPGRVPPHVATMMTAVACRVRQSFDLPLGINVLRNDGRAALAIAVAAQADFIRVNVLCGARLTDQGIVSGIAHDLLRDRAQLGASVKILADVQVKHSQSLSGESSFPMEVHELANRGGADAIIVSGSATGHPIDPLLLDAAREHCQLPVLVGSGVREEQLSTLMPRCDGLIVGSALKVDGDVMQAVDPRRVAEFMQRRDDAIRNRQADTN